jgi:hypothetical protein
MVSDLLFSQLGRIALGWLGCLLPWGWPSDRPTVLAPLAQPTPPRPKRHREPNPFAGLPTRLHCDAWAHPTAPRPHAPAAPPHLVMTRGRRR